MSEKYVTYDPMVGCMVKHTFRNDALMSSLDAFGDTLSKAWGERDDDRQRRHELVEVEEAEYRLTPRPETKTAKDENGISDLLF
jgi:hypothetical protein